MLRRAICVTAALALAATSTAAFAQGAKVGSAQGAVFANRAGQMTPLKAGSALQTGDRVVATSGSARITFSDGCNVSVAARTMITVAETSPCAGGSSGLVKVADGDRGYPPGRWVWTNEGMVWVAAGVVTGAVVLTRLNGNNDKPASP